MKVLIACEFSGNVREAFLKQGHNAWSCDLLDTETPGKHLKCSVLDVIHDKWDIMIAFPPCTHLCSSGARWFKFKKYLQDESLRFIQLLMDADIPRIAIENPIGVISTRIRPPDQIIQPWQFGHPETKATCLWLKGLPKLNPANIVSGRTPRVHRVAPSPDRWKERSRTLQGIASAMAIQWGKET